MRLFLKLFSRLRALFRRDALDREMDEEMRFHLEMQARENSDAGVPGEEAEHLARRQFGRLDGVKEAVRARRSMVWLESLVRDVSYALRSLRRSPGFTCTVIMMLALGIGVNTAVFTVVNDLLLRPLPVKNPGNLYTIRYESPAGPSGMSQIPLLFDAFQGAVTSLAPLEGFGILPLGRDTNGVQETFLASSVTPGYFSTLGISPYRGRFFSASNDPEVADEPVAVISYGYWQSQFGGRDDAIGSTIAAKYIGARGLAHQNVTIIGIAPPGFTGLMRGPAPGAWVTTETAELLGHRWGTGWSFNFGRLAPGVTRGQAEAELATIADRLSELLGTAGGHVSALIAPDSRLVLEPVGRGKTAPFDNPQVREQVEWTSTLLVAAVATVLLIACANAASLQLARTIQRQREIAVRLTLGVGRWRLLRHLLVESLILVLGGAALGTLLAWWGVKTLLLIRSGPVLSTSIVANISPDPDIRILGFSLTLALLTAVVFGVAPAIRALRVDINRTLGGRPLVVRWPWRMRARDLLVITQVTLCLVLLIAAGLALRSLVQINAVDPGFDTNVLAAEVRLPSDNDSDAAAKTFARELIQRLETHPAVVSSSYTILATPLPGSFRPPGPVSDELFNRSMKIEGYERPPGETATYGFEAISARFFQTLGISVLRGREFDDRDRDADRKVTVVNESFVRRYWPDQDPIGKHVHNDFEVIGVVRDARLHGAWVKPLPIAFHLLGPRGWGHVLVRTRGSSEDFAPTLRETVEAVDSSVDVLSIESLRSVWHDSLGGHRMLLIVLGIFAGVAALMAAIGLYGLMAYTVAQRTREIGIRLAIGAQRRNVIALVLKRGLSLTVGGIVFGLLAALGLTRFLQSLLYDLSPTDSVTFVLVALAFLAVATLACLLPARRAAKIDPAITLRAE